MEMISANESLVKTLDPTKQATEQITEQATEQTTEQTANVEDSQKALEEDSYSDLVKSIIQNTLKLMSGQHGGGFYIKYVVDEGTCYGWLNLIIVYPEGYFKSLILYKDYLKETDVDSSNGVYTVERKRQRTRGIPTVPFWDEDPSLDHFDSLKPYESPTMPIPERAIWAKIQENYREIPINTINHTTNVQQLIAGLQEWAAEKAQLPGCGFMDDADKCYIEAEDFRSIVQANGWNVAQARTELDLLGMFDKDKTAHGYQKTKRVGDTIKHFYVIKKIQFKSENRPKYLPDTSYNCAYVPELMKTNRHLQKEVEELADRCNELLRKYEPDAEDII